ncbi:DUF11 domain-containing protein [Candidatus Acetothermia bacterium]|nr:DUF11 domain-containing protein [Candidatus Acetothermia bacterium]
MSFQCTFTNTQTPPTSPGTFIYSAKFICGNIPGPLGLLNPEQEPPVKPGNYTTAINVHNPGAGNVDFKKKVALTFPPGSEKPGDISKIFGVSLGPDRAFEIDCRDIAKLAFPPPPPQFPPDGVVPDFIKGFVVIESPQLLDVVAVYTSELILDKNLVKLGFPPGFALAAKFPLPTGTPIAFTVPDIGNPGVTSGAIAYPIEEVKAVIRETLRAAKMKEDDISMTMGHIQIQIEDVSVALGQTLDVEEVKPKSPPEQKCDLAIKKTADVNQTLVYFAVTVTNVGNAPCPPTTTVTDNLPSGLAGTSLNPNTAGGWTCPPGPPGSIMCTNATTLQPNQSSMVFTVVGTFATKVENCATVSNPNDMSPPNNPANNKSCVTVP